MESQPKITVGILERRDEVNGRLDGNFVGNGFGPASGRFSAKVETGMIVFTDEVHGEVRRSPTIILKATKDLTSLAKSHDPFQKGEERRGSGQTVTLFDVTIGSRFHWERTEDQSFQGDLILQLCKGGTLCGINEIPLEDYLTSVICSEMSAEAPGEFLKAHAILSRSWILAAIDRKKETREGPVQTVEVNPAEGEVICWHDRQDHELFDVCADDHCQRYQGISKIIAEQAKDAVRETCGVVITYQGRICDARYSKACGGITEEFDTAWNDRRVPYLTSISDAAVPHRPIRKEEEASRWILSEPEAYCNAHDTELLAKILPNSDRETRSFFRWRIEYSRTELEEILREKSGFDFGTLQKIVPLRRGPSGRIFLLEIAGSKKRMVVGKELEIRRWLSRSHLYSSAFVVTEEYGSSGDAKRFVFNGAGWGHGVGLCQIGAAVMAIRGFSAEEILKHYFRGVELKKIY